MITHTSVAKWLAGGVWLYLRGFDERQRLARIAAKALLEVKEANRAEEPTD
jgi:hypothetical protein